MNYPEHFAYIDIPRVKIRSIGALGTSRRTQSRLAPGAQKSDPTSHNFNFPLPIVPLLPTTNIMEALRHSLFAPSTTTFLLTVGCVQAMMEMVKIRYAAKDENGKPLVRHPYEPWNVPTDPKYKEALDKVYRSFKMFENIKEWTFMSLPLIWIFAIYGGALPYMTDFILDGIILGTGALYAFGNGLYINGYIEAPEKRLQGFTLRKRISIFWMWGSAISLLWAGLSRFGLVQ